MKEENKLGKAVFIKSFKTKRLDGHAVKTIYALLNSGIVNIERRIVSTELNDGFQQIRRFGKYIYQYESMTFKLQSFIEIATDVRLGVSELDKDNLIQHDDVMFSPNEKTLVKIYTDK